jgi:hypothetical protein
MFRQHRNLVVPVALLAAVALLLTNVGCDDDFEEWFEDWDLPFFNGFGGGRYNDCGGCYSCGRCGGGGYYVVDDWYDSWWW